MRGERFRNGTKGILNWPEDSQYTRSPHGGLAAVFGMRLQVRAALACHGPYGGHEAGQVLNGNSFH